MLTCRHNWFKTWSPDWV